TVVHIAALRSLRVLHGSAQAYEPERVERVARPTLGLARAQVSPLALQSKPTKTPPHVGVDLVELRGSVPGAEVVAPAAEHGVQLADHDAQIPVTPRPRSQLLHALTHPLHRASGRPP